MSEGETPTPSPPVEHASHIANRMSPTEVKELIQECNHLHLENARLRDLVCWLRGQFEGMQNGMLTLSEEDFFARKEMEDAWDIMIQQKLIEHIEGEMGESNDE